ncbi:hypothetical protein [Helicobacter salomonis]|uniref:hypothetical protein n=2 Tax=Helicobacter salomonis TaxID=56878 RepID=UPI000CF1BE7A|nr:hypothetical protein [Helicobacter salomonis]
MKIFFLFLGLVLISLIILFVYDRLGLERLCLERYSSNSARILMDDKLFGKQALHAANIFSFAWIVFYIVFIHDGLRARWIDVFPFVMCLEMGAIILALCPNKHISLGLIALGFVLCYYGSPPPPRYMGAITFSVGALIFWAYIGDKKWWLFFIPPSIAIIMLTTLIYCGVILFCVFCTYPIKNAHWLVRCSIAIAILSCLFPIMMIVN